MKYKDVSIEEARKCCKTFKQNCDKCPLRREKKDQNGKLHKLFCWYIMLKFYENIEEEQEELNKEDIYYQKEWDEYINNLKTEEK